VSVIGWCRAGGVVRSRGGAVFRALFARRKLTEVANNSQEGSLFLSASAVTKLLPGAGCADCAVVRCEVVCLEWRGVCLT
jgi:hypothetical protein